MEGEIKMKGSPFHANPLIWPPPPHPPPSPPLARRSSPQDPPPFAANLLPRAALVPPSSSRSSPLPREPARAAPPSGAASTAPWPASLHRYRPPRVTLTQREDAPRRPGTPRPRNRADTRRTRRNHPRLLLRPPRSGVDSGRSGSLLSSPITP
jgi:hypothetical protein